MADESLASISLEKVDKRFGQKLALRNVSVSFSVGCTTALLGANGAGKSTLLALASTLSQPSRGAVTFRSGDGSLSPAQTRGSIGVLSHASLLYGHLSARENLMFFAKAYRSEAPKDVAATLLKQVGLSEEAWDLPVSGFSRGMTQRVSLARSLVGNPTMLLWDEPLTGLDNRGIEVIVSSLTSLREQGKGVIIVSHELSPLDGLVDHCVVLARGRKNFDDRRETAFTASQLGEALVAHGAPKPKRRAGASQKTA